MWSTVYVRKYVWCKNIVDANIMIIFTADTKMHIYKQPVNVDTFPRVWLTSAGGARLIAEQFK
jgi:hypothetical protein